MLPFYSAIMTVLRLKRTCPACKQDFVLHPGDKKKDFIICPHCKKRIANPKKSREE